MIVYAGGRRDADDFARRLSLLYVYIIRLRIGMRALNCLIDLTDAVDVSCMLRDSSS